MLLWQATAFSYYTCLLSSIYDTRFMAVVYKTYLSLQEFYITISHQPLSSVHLPNHSNDLPFPAFRFLSGLTFGSGTSSHCWSPSSGGTPASA
jgi:hypothetical protein